MGLYFALLALQSNASDDIYFCLAKKRQNSNVVDQENNTVINISVIFQKLPSKKLPQALGHTLFR